MAKTYRQRIRAETLDLIRKLRPDIETAFLSKCRRLLEHVGHPFDTPTERINNQTKFLIDLIETVKGQPQATTLADVAAGLKYKDKSSIKRQFRDAKSLLDPQPQDWPTFVQLCAQGAFDAWIVEHTHRLSKNTN